MSRNQLLIGLVVLAVAALGAAGYFVFFSGNSSDVLPATGEKANVQITSWDRKLGSPHAPVTIVEYAAPTCPVCANFDMTVYPELKRKLIDTGKVYYVFRVFPLSQYDVAAESIARCLPETSYFQFIDFLYHNQALWDPDGHQIPDVHAALVQMAGTAGLSPQKTDACIADQTVAKRVAQVGMDAQNKYQIDRTPSFLINGKLEVGFEDYQQLADYLAPLLAGK